MIDKHLLLSLGVQLCATLGPCERFPQQGWQTPWHREVWVGSGDFCLRVQLLPMTWNTVRGLGEGPEHTKA